MKAGARRSTRWVLILLIAILGIAVPAWAQDEAGTAAASGDDAGEDAVTGAGDWLVGVEAWSAQPSGLGFVPASIEDPTNPFDTEVQPIAFDTKLRGRWQIGYVFPNKMGRLVLTWFSHKDIRFRNEFSPGQFLYVEQNITPGFAGVFDDGRADGYHAEAEVVHRDLRLDFYREAFSGTRLKASWFVGYRRVIHRRSMDSEFFALAPNLPPLLEPLTGEREDLVPNPDFSSTYSDVEVRGAEAGLEVTMPVWSDKVHFDAGFSVAVLRGRETTDYVSLTYAYALTDGLEILEILEPPFDELNQYEDPNSPGTGPPVDRIRQILLPTSLNQTNDSTDSQVLETFLGLRWKAWKNLQLSLGFRAARYDDIGVEIYPRETDGTDALRETFSVNYEGYYLGALYRW